MKKAILLVVLWGANLALYAQKIIRIEQNNQVLAIGQEVYFYEDAHNQLTFEKVSLPEFAQNFKLSTQSIPSFRLPKGALWLKFQALNLTNQACLLELSNRRIDSIYFYYPIDNQQYKLRLIDNQQPSSENFGASSFLLELDNLQKTPKTYFLKIVDTYSIQLPIRVGTKSAIFQNMFRENLEMAAYLGIILAIFVYNLFLYSINRDKVYLYYSLYIFYLFLYLFYDKGYLHLYFPNSTGFSNYFPLIIGEIANIFSVLFASKFLQLKKYNPFFNRFFLYIVYANIGILLFHFTDYQSFTLFLFQVLLIITYFSNIFCSVLIFRKGYKPVKFYLLGWFLFSACILIYLAMVSGIFPYTHSSKTVFLSGILLEIVFFSIALGTRVRILRKEKKQVLEQKITERIQEIAKQYEEIRVQNERLHQNQEEILTQQQLIEKQNHSLQKVNRKMKVDEEILRKAYLKMKEKEALIQQQNLKLEEKNYEIEAQNEELRLQKEEIEALNDHLEDLVRLRTEELQNTVEELSDQNQDLEQFSYIISHNMRAPVARIIGLMSLFNKEQMDEPFNHQILTFLEQSALNLDMIIKDLTQIITIRNKLEKIMEVIDLQELTFSVLETLRDEIIQTDALINIDFEPQPILISVKSYLQNIIFNLISNALKYKSPERNPKIELKIQKNDDFYCISVQDNGIGIDLTQIQLYKIFGLYQRVHTQIDGKGIGLYLVKNQVEVLKGKVEVESTPNVGSIFKIYLPREANN